MKTNQFYQNIPILVIDMADFSKYNTTQKRLALETLDHILTSSAAIAAVNWKEWIRHGTGDGYYILFGKNTSTKTAMDYSINIAKSINAHNEINSTDLRICLRAALGLGNVQLINNDNWEGDAMIQVARFLDDHKMKTYLEFLAREKHLYMVLAMTSEFHFSWAQTANQETKTHFVAFSVRDKHHFNHNGYIWDRGMWTEHNKDQPQGSHGIPGAIATGAAVGFLSEVISDKLADVKLASIAENSYDLFSDKALNAIVEHTAQLGTDLTVVATPLIDSVLESATDIGGELLDYLF